MPEKYMTPTFGWGSLISQGVANTITAFGSFATQKKTNAALRSQANIARINADLMERKYQATLANAEKAITRQTMAAGRTKHSQRASLAANGIAIGEGSAAEQLASTDFLKEVDKNQAQANAVSEAWGYRWAKNNALAQARAAEARRQSAGLTAGLTLLAGAQQTGFDYFKMQQQGVFQKSQDQQQDPDLSWYLL